MIFVPFALLNGQAGFFRTVRQKEMRKAVRKKGNPPKENRKTKGRKANRQNRCALIFPVTGDNRHRLLSFTDFKSESVIFVRIASFYFYLLPRGRFRRAAKRRNSAKRGTERFHPRKKPEKSFARRFPLCLTWTKPPVLWRRPTPGFPSDQGAVTVCLLKGFKPHRQKELPIIFTLKD